MGETDTQSSRQGQLLPRCCPFREGYQGHLGRWLCRGARQGKAASVTHNRGDCCSWEEPDRSHIYTLMVAVSVETRSLAGWC